MDPLPSVLHYLKDEEKRNVTFIKPAKGKELEALHEDVGLGIQPTSKVLAVRMMTLECNTVIPFHVHDGKGKEKLYVFHGPDVLQVLVVDDAYHLYKLTAGEQLIIPAGCPHCVGYFPIHHTLPCRVLVITSSRDFDDIRWEDAADDLIKNRHLKLF